MNVIPDIFNEGKTGLSSVKYTCAGGGIVADAAGDGGVADSEGGGNGDGSADDVASVDGSVAAASGYGSAVYHRGVSGGLATGSDGAVCS